MGVTYMVTSGNERGRHFSVKKKKKKNVGNPGLQEPELDQADPETLLAMAHGSHLSMLPP